MIPLITRSLVILTALVLFCDQGYAENTAEPWNSWQTHIDRDHPLVGRIWSVKDNKFVGREDLVNVLVLADFRLLGETHDNPDHHRLQAWLTGEIAASGIRPTLVVEMIDRDQSMALQTYLNQENADAAGLGAALDWADHGWPDWAMYQPIAEAAFTHDLRITFGNEPRSFVRAAATNGLYSLGQDRLNTLQFDEPFAKPLEASLRAQIVDSHCGLIPAEAAAPMIVAQRLRDAVMAEQMIINADQNGVILIAGSGHVRSDRGVPWYLRHHAKNKIVVSVMLIEAQEGLDLHDLISLNPVNEPATDYAWFTPRAEREDPCEEMRRQRGKTNTE